MIFSYKRQRPCLGAMVLFLSKSKFIDMSVQHGMACNLEAEDQMKLARENGKEVLDRWEKRYRRDYTEMTNEIKSALFSSLLSILAVSILAFGIACYFGYINFSMPIDYSKTITFIGSMIIAWATLMELGGDFNTYDGKAFPQQAHSIIFKSLFVPGVFLVLIGLLI